MTLSHPLPEPVVDLVVERFRILGEPVRIRLLESMLAGEATVQELVAATGGKQQNVSKHLGVLLQAGIVGRRKQGNFSWYSIADQGVFALCEDVCGSLEAQLDSLRELVEGVRR